MDKVPAVPKVRREPRQLRDIRGPSQVATDFTEGQYGILVSRNRQRTDRGGEDSRPSISVSLSCPALSPCRLWAEGTCTGATLR